MPPAVSSSVFFASKYPPASHSATQKRFGISQQSTGGAGIGVLAALEVLAGPVPVVPTDTTASTEAEEHIPVEAAQVH